MLGISDTNGLASTERKSYVRKRLIGLASATTKVAVTTSGAHYKPKRFVIRLERLTPSDVETDFDSHETIPGSSQATWKFRPLVTGNG